jgi:hypothetical protein
MRSTPTSALEVLLMLPPLSIFIVLYGFGMLIIFIEKESRQAAYRLKGTGRLNRAVTQKF